MFGPIAVVAVGGVGFGEEGAVAAVRGFDERDVGVRIDGGARGWAEADEGIVQRVQNERGDSDAVEDARGGGAVVVVVRGLEAGVERGDAVVEVAQRADVRATLRVEHMWEEHGLAAETAQQRAKKSPLVEAVLPVVQSVGGCLEVYRGRHAYDAAELGRRVGAEVSGEF